VHYSVPIPGTLSLTDLELFGFWTIELRVGHILWSTAQARYGRALRVSGVQFPPPPLTVSVDRLSTPPLPAPALPSIVAVADLAQTVANGVSLTFPAHPQTEIWYLLYAQVPRVDGQAWRNILLARALGRQPETKEGELVWGAAGQRSAIATYGVFAQKTVRAALAKLQLSRNTPLSVLAVELFNREAKVIPPPAGPKAEDEVIVNQEDPLGTDLGARRVLRVSPLMAVRAVC